jgi:ferredoxin
MTAEHDVYRKLQRHLDNMPIGYPATSSGVEIRLLKHLFTPEEAEIALHLSALPEPLERIHKRLKRPRPSVEELETILDRLTDKGAILRRMRKGREKHYSKLILAVGMYEFQVDRLTKEYEEDFEQYLGEGFAEQIHSKKTSQLRTIPINRTVIPDRHVGTYDDGREIVRRSKGPFAAANCICRQGKDLLGQSCRQTDIRKTCLMLEGVARFYIETGRGQAITKEEMLEILDRADEAGLVLQPQNTQSPKYICCCCGCCCAALQSAKRFENPAEYFHNNYFARVDPELCTGCETCATRCQMEALTLVDDVTQVDLSRCIGCGLCVSTCPSDAIRLEQIDRPEVPPKDDSALYMKITRERFGPWGTAKIMGKALLRRKI